MKFSMSDGRAFTSYEPNCTLNAVLQKKYGTTDIHAFRSFLQQNSEQVMKDLQNNTSNISYDKKTCPVCNNVLTYNLTGNVNDQV